MSTKKFLIYLICISGALSLSGCATISSGWDWFFGDDDKQVAEAEYAKEMDEEALIAEEALLEEELAAEEFADDEEMAEEEEMMEDEEMADEEEMMEDDYGDSPAALRQPSDGVVYFDYKSTKVSASALNILQAHAQYLQANPDSAVALIGNTDSVASSDYNKRLGLKRAEAVAEILVEMGVEPSQLRLVSRGKSNPAADDGSERAAALNRRVEIVYE